MKAQLGNILIVGTSLLSLFGLSEILYKKFKVDSELSRKLSHTGSGLIALLFPFLFKSTWLVVGLCLGFFAILLLSKRRKMLGSIHEIQRESSGAMWFPIAVAICFTCSQYFGNWNAYFIPILILSISDPLACIVGQRYPLKKINFWNVKKSVGGCLAFFISAAIIGFFASNELPLHPTHVVAVAILTMIAELISGKGTDNLSIPITGMIAILLFQSNLSM